MISPKINSSNFGYLDALPLLMDEYSPIDLSEEYSGLQCSPSLIESLEKYIRRGINQYSHAFGLMRLREKISAKIEYLHKRTYHPESEITITSGNRQAIFSIISAFVREGDQVIVFEPFSGNYSSAIELNGGVPVYVKLSEPEFAIDWENVQKMMNSKTRMIILNSPHNPTGWVMSELDLIRLQRIITGTKIIILSDETFEHITFDENAHQSMASFPKLAEQSIIVCSLAETFHVTGWQIGYCAAPADLMREIRKVQQLIIHSVNSPIQEALADFLDIKEEYLRAGKFFQERRDRLLALMEPSKFKPILSKGTYFQLFSYQLISNLSDREYALQLIKEAGVALAPVSLYFHEKGKYHLLRMNFAQPDEVLENVAERLCRL